MYVGYRSIVEIGYIPRWDLSILIDRERSYAIHRLSLKIYNHGRWTMERSFHKISHRLKSIESGIWRINGFDKLSLTWVMKGLTIEESNYTITAYRGLIFYSTRLSLHTDRCHWWIVRLIEHRLNDQWSLIDRVRIVPTHRKKFQWYCDRDHSISHYQTEYNLWDHTQNRSLSNQIVDLWLWITEESNCQYDWWLIQCKSYNKIIH